MHCAVTCRIFGACFWCCRDVMWPLAVQMVSYKVIKAPNGDAWVEVRTLVLDCSLDHFVLLVRSPA